MAGTLLERHALITRAHLADPILHMPAGCQLQRHPSMPSASSLLFLLWLFRQAEQRILKIRIGD
ncbi:MAG: hypothetical protein Q8P67_10580 [archaeon]|nr:hypothetical protein [archaeon]